MDFKLMKWILSPAIMEGETVIKPEAAIMYGNFIQNVVDFLIVSICIFLFVKLINKSKAELKTQATLAPELPKGPTQEELLIEIRDLLKNK